MKFIRSLKNRLRWRKSIRLVSKQQHEGAIHTLKQISPDFRDAKYRLFLAYNYAASGNAHESISELLHGKDLLSIERQRSDITKNEYKYLRVYTENLLNYCGYDLADISLDFEFDESAVPGATKAIFPLPSSILPTDWCG